MIDKIRIRSIGILITCSLLSLLPSVNQGQSRRRLNAPPALLEILDKEDRDCVVTNGGLNRSVHVQPIQLAANPSRQMLVRGSGLCLCGAQNCLFWIYRQTGNRYELLLTGAGSTKVSAGQKSAKGYRDVITESHASAAETILRTYRYDGSGYRLQSCINRAYYNDNGDYTKNPTLRPCVGEKKSEPESKLSSSLLDNELTTIDNEHLKLSDYSDRTVIVNLCASWAGPCFQSFPYLNRIAKEYKKRIQVIGVVTKENDPRIESVRTFASRLGIEFPVVWDDVGFSESLIRSVNGRNVIPQTFIIDKNGGVSQVFSRIQCREYSLLIATSYR